MIRQAIQKIGVYMYCLPTFRQARLTLFDSMTNSGVRFLDYIPKELIANLNSQEMKIRLINGSIINLIGSDTYDTSLIGTNPRMIVFSEYALSDERAYHYIRPIMNANNGLVVFLSTPRGHNHFHQLYEIARNSPDWWVSKLTVEDCRHIPLSLIEQDIANGEISEDMVQQEYYCDFNSGQQGSYYGKYIDKMRLEGHIGQVDYESAFPVHTSWDLGFRDDTSIIFYQTIGTTVRIIDCYSKSKEGLEHYINVIKNKPYLIYGKHIAPHDIGVTEFAAGQTRLQKARQLGINFTLANNVSIMDGIESCRSAFSKIWIDEKKCAPLIKALEGYRQEYDTKRKVYNAKPLHDINSHYCFVGDTQISMDKGSMPIKDIKPGMLVKTPFGIRKVLEVHKWLTNKLVDITINKTVLTCTPHHNIFTQRGLVKADALSYTDIVEHNSIIRRFVWQKIYGLYSKALNLNGFKRIFLSLKIRHKSVSMDTFLDGMETITKGKQTHGRLCNVLSGCIIMGQYLKGFIYTILMVTKRTMHWITYNVLIGKYTNENIVLSQTHGRNQINLSKYYMSYEEKQQSGIEVQKVENGTSNMHKKACQSCKEYNIHLNVSPVQKTSWVRWFGVSSVQMVAKQSIEHCKERTLKIAIAVYAKVYSLVVNTLLRRHVVKNVRTYQLAEPNWVYDLTIETDNCYYANNYLVSNSDSFRYLCVSLSKTRDGLSAQDLDKRYNEAILQGVSNLPRPFKTDIW
jgi:hypothetical protein